MLLFASYSSVCPLGDLSVTSKVFSVPSQLVRVGSSTSSDSLKAKFPTHSKVFVEPPTILYSIDKELSALLP